MTTDSHSESTRRRRPNSIAGSALLVLLAVCSATPALAAHPHAGFLYGQVDTKDGKTFTGLLRWGTEEAFWDDLFNSAKTELPYLEDFGDENEKRERTISIFGREIRMRLGDWSETRHFVTRFGDIDRIEPSRDAAKLLMRDGTEIEVSGAANDVDATIEVVDAAVGLVKVPWAKIARIQLRATPASVEPRGFRLWGTVETSAGPFEGWVQWDKQECLSYDILDGEEDGIEVELEMGRIQTIERHSKRASRVVLRDGREFVLEGTNDVDDDNRGILVEDVRFGRVEVSWSEFQRVTFRATGAEGPHDSGAAYDAFGRWGELRGTVIDRDGKRLRGRLVYDLDEAYGWEMLDGKKDGIAYSIPFGMVSRIAPRTDAAIVTLRGGEELRLADTQDVAASNAGVLVIGDGEDPVHIPWDRLDVIELEW